MRQKIIQHAHEQALQQKQKKLPRELTKEIQAFYLRNIISFDKIQNRIIFRYCPQCMKAHAVKTANNLGLEEETKDILQKLFKCETGHNGYYLDEGNLIEI